MLVGPWDGINILCNTSYDDTLKGHDPIRFKGILWDTKRILSCLKL